MVIDGYDIKSEIHRGPVTTVYDANHLALGRRVILKVLNTQWTEEKDLIERFRREAKICARLDHPNIVKIFDFSASNDSVFISMEYIEGSTLDMLIKQNKIINFSEIIRIASKILNGLSYAHKQGIIHRDIKPSNIMISSEGQVKITDFGLAVVSDLPGITNQDQAVGSPAYMSPEQVLGKDIDQRSDLFSLGVSLYKFCAKKAPFETDNIGTTIQNILTKEVENLSNINATLPLWFSDLIDTLLAKNREDRPDSADIVLGIFDSQFKTDKTEQHVNTAKTLLPFNLQARKASLFTYFNVKSRKRIFLGAFPLIAILVYLIFKPADEERSVQDIPLNSFMNIRSTQIQDTTKMMHSENNGEDKNIIEEIRNLSVLDSAVSADQTNKTNIKLQKTSSSISQTGKSQILIIARPWAYVYIDSIYYEETPLTNPISITPGHHLIELKNPNHQTFSQSYYFNPVQSETLIVDMEIKVGFLNIRVLPWAKIYIDGEYKETSPIDNSIAVTAGEHILTLTNPYFMSISDTIEISKGKSIDKKYNLSK